jgi:CRP/FNR family transcriptional regulator, cyclic AMP receptor protein
MDAKTGARVLSEHGWLSRTPAPFRDAILKSCQWRHYAAGESLFVAGDPPGGLFGVAEGSVGGATALGPAETATMHIGQPGFWTGEGPIITGGDPRRITVFAVTPAFIATVPLAELKAILAAHPEWWQHIAQLAQATNDFVGSALADSMIRDADCRCAAILLRLCDCRFIDNPFQVEREVMITQEELAAMANLSRGSVSSILRRLAKRKLIEIRYRSIVVTDTRNLRQSIEGR